jgi:Dolichyl-phosphate-mannose-protein mannosyltransferase
MNRQPTLAVTVALFALLFLVPAWPWLSGAVIIPYDAQSTFYPPVAFMARAFASGDSPFWTPNIYAGWPMIADPQAMLTSPLHVLLAVATRAPSVWANDVVTFAYLFAGGLGIILYFHDRGWHRAGALVAALAFAFGGSASGRLQHTGQIMSLAYLPVTLWLLSRALDRNSWKYGALAGAVAALIVLGRDQIALLNVYVMAGFVFTHWCGDGWISRLRASILPLVAGGVAGLVIIALPVALTEILATDSNRPEFSFTEVGKGSLHYTHLLSLMFADLFGAMDPKVDFWAAGSNAWTKRFAPHDLFLAQNMGLLYAGAIVPVLLIVGAARGWLWSREIRFFTIAALLIAFFMFGYFTPVFYAMYELMPGVKLFRRPADATFVLGGLLAIIAGYLTHRWLESPPARRLRGRIALAIFAAIAISAIWLADTTVGLDMTAAPIVTGLCFALAAIFLLRIARNHSAVTALVLLGAFCAADLAFNNARHESTGLSPSVYDALNPDTKNETVALIRERLTAQEPNHRDRVELIGIQYHWPNICLIHGCEHVFGHNPLRLKWFYEATNAQDTVAAPGQRVFSALYPRYRSPVADLLGLRLVATGIPVEQIDKKFQPGDLNFVARTKDAYIYENPRALPRVMMFADWRVADTAKLMTEGWPADVDPAKTVLLDRTPPASPLSSFEAAGTARLVSYKNTEIVIEANSPSGGVLLLNDVWHPWWFATIDGHETDIFRANAIFRAIQLPPGKFTVRFTFRPLRGAWKEAREKFR